MSLNRAIAALINTMASLRDWVVAGLISKNAFWTSITNKAAFILPSFARALSGQQRDLARVKDAVLHGAVQHDIERAAHADRLLFQDSIIQFLHPIDE